MFFTPYFNSGYWARPYFPGPTISGDGDWFPTPYFGPRNAPGDFWIIGRTGPTPPPVRTVDGGGGGWDVVKNRQAQQREELRLAIVREDDALVFDVVKIFLREIQ